MRAVYAFFAVALAAAIAFSLFQLLRDERPIGSENLIGQPLPEFAAPLAASGIDADSNVTSRAVAERSGDKAACDVDLPGAFVSCRDLAGARAVLVFWSLRKRACVDQIDALDEAFAGEDDTSVVAVSFNDDLDDVAREARERGWKIPVAVDRDGAASIVYSVAGCPTIYFAENGTVRGVRLATLGADELRRELDTAVGRPAGATR